MRARPASAKAPAVRRSFSEGGCSRGPASSAATSMVEISRLIDPDMLVEIEAEAIVES